MPAVRPRASRAGSSSASRWRAPSPSRPTSCCSTSRSPTSTPNCAEMRVELRELQHRLSFTSVYVTHDQEEALAISDRVIVMNGGRIEQIGAPEDIYRHPRTPFVADFVGNANVIRGQAQGTPAADGSIAFLTESGLILRA